MSIRQTILYFPPLSKTAINRCALTIGKVRCPRSGICQEGFNLQAEYGIFIDKMGAVTMLPAELHNLFWDTRPEELDVKQHATFILERILEFGNAQAVDWALRTYPLTEIEHVVRNSRRISRKTANYWAIRLGVPEKQVRRLQEDNPFWRH